MQRMLKMRCMTRLAISGGPWLWKGAGLACGTPAFMAPELFMVGRCS